MITDEAKSVKAGAYAEYIRDLVKRKHVQEMEIEHQREELDLSGVAFGERVTTSPSANAIPDGVAKLIGLIESYTTDLCEYVEEIETFSKVLAKLKPQQQMTLYMRYVMLKDWKTVAKQARYSEPRLYEIRREALISLYDVMPEVWRSQMIPNATP